MQKPIVSFLESAKSAIRAAEDSASLEQLRLKYLGKKGELTELLKAVGQLPPEDKPRYGQAINQAKQELQALLTERDEYFRKQVLEAQLASERIDVTLPGRGDTLGSLHPVTRVRDRLEQLFGTLGFRIMEGPEIEDEYHNFTALNFIPHHPARTLQDTFYFAGDQLLRTHTSPVQIRAMKKYGVPIRLLALGRVYRPDYDQTHTPMFHQAEGLVVDKNCTFSDLKGLLQDFLQQYFERPLKMRFRPSYFPFTEPSAEIDIFNEEIGAWLEIIGAGMVHPRVLENVGVDPEEYSGFAFGVGLDRLAMLRYRVPDLRLFFENDLRFLAQF
ncbi:MAG: phenylalanine--tRNA ligase subunit alpha [Coxiella sp. RIFCSPHIGHO2_12_FULL_44_14]|nr:MAG: phenylalanine--tRNA ligase subunit alpha [Coxiella sp. RIFCSPHIGHO2_12_FULL_44_14]